MMSDEKMVCRYCKLRDRFGDNGLISVLILEKQKESELYINSWLMSCRVLSRGMEEFVNNEIISIARSLNFKNIVGTYIPTKKNQLVQNHYKKLNYSLRSMSDQMSTWTLDVENSVETRPTFIKRVCGEP